MDADSLLLTVFGEYEVIRAADRGAMGEGFKALVKSDSRVVRLEILPERLSKNAMFLERFKRGSDAAAALSHPNILRVHCVGKDRELVFVAMENVSGGRFLSKLLATEGRLSVRRALEITRQAAGALSCAHEAGIVHLDVKPHNLVVDQENRTWIVGFGFRKALDDIFGVSLFLPQMNKSDLPELPYYKSPEQCRAEGVDSHSDVYSLGVVLLEMLTGRLPHEEDETTELISTIIEAPVPWLKEVCPDASVALESVAGAMLDKDPENRITAAQLCDVLDSMIEDLGEDDEPLALAPQYERSLAGEGAGDLEVPSDARWMARVLRGNWYLVAACLGMFVFGAFMSFRYDEPLAVSKAPRARVRRPMPSPIDSPWRVREDEKILESIEEYRAKLERDPLSIDVPRTLSALGNLYYAKLRDYKQAAYYYERLLAEHRDWAGCRTVWPSLVTCYERLEMKEVALSTRERMMEYYPDDEPEALVSAEAPEGEK